MAESHEPAPGRSLRDIPWVWVGVVVVMLVAALRSLLAPAPEHPLVGTPVAELSLPVADDSGDRMRLEDLRGQVVLLEFWATWCGACRASTPAFNALSERYADRGLLVLGINTDAKEAPMAAAGHRTFAARYPTVFDPEHRAQIAFSVDSLPTLVLIDREGIVRRVSVGVPEERRWAGWINDLL